MAGGSIKMQPPSDRADSLLLSRSSAGPRDQEQQVQLRQKLRELPALLRSGLTLRRKSSATGGRIISRRISNPYLENPSSKIYGEGASCAGRALRNVFILQASDLMKDRMSLMGLCRRSCIGSELVDWLLKSCAFIKSRSTAAGVWQLLLNMGIVLSVDRQIYFQDKYIFYQFSADECTYLFCEYEGDEGWKNGVKFLLQLVPVPPRINTCNLSTQKIEDTTETNAEILARLTSAVQRELVAVLAMKARKSALAMNQNAENSNEEAAGQEDHKEIYDAQAGVMCKLQEREDIGRLELVQKLAKENCHLLQADNREPEKTNQLDDEVTTIQVKELDQDVLVLRKVSSHNPAPTSGSVANDWRYVVVSGTPEKILEHLLNDLHLEEVQDKETETLLDDFLLTYTVFMTTDDLCQALLRHYCAKNHQGKEEILDVACRKRKVLHLVSQWTSLYKDWLHEDEHLKQFLKTIYRNVLDDVYEYPILEKDLKEFQKLLGMHRRHTVDEYSPHRKHKAILHQFSLKENWLQNRGTMNETEEVFCRVYITEHSYVSVKTKVSTLAQEILKIVAEKLQHSQEDLALVAVSFSGEKHELQPNDLAISKSLESSARMFVFRKDLTDTLNPFAENEETQQRSVRILGINTWDLALELTNFDWNLFNLIHEQELIYFTFSRQGSGENTVNLSLLLQRCNEVQLWVATEILLCNQLCKRVQLVKKFIKIAAHCKAQRNLNSFFAIVMGLNTASVSRLSQTWERIPGKFKKLFTELENLTDPSLNHKAYRDAFKKMKSPKIPFMPLLLKDVTFIHEGNKTFLDNLVNFEKLHMIADTVRSLRYCRHNQFGNEVPSKEHQELKPYVHHLHIIDNQQMLFELSHRIEPRV
ncbi:rap guanine nucleotide exchange factor 5 isoform X2 [Hemicordylus capensis]|uniref:rap guanine nucleotide exchange factor 5 isoform X2 n=1 Tax=Hemicordylus capensis TaxID=884348 RepID=UPI002303B4BB|nr:rap guanine nucleotide exchange factor 5 isoform X2 [Hemicordylus capensis]